MRLKKYGGVLYGMNMLINIDCPTKVQMDILLHLTNTLFNQEQQLEGEDPLKPLQSLEIDEESRKRLLGELEQLLVRLSEKKNDPELWFTYGKFYEYSSDFPAYFDCLQKELRAIKVAGWNETKEEFGKTVETTKRLVEELERERAWEEEAPKVKLVKSYKMLVKKMLKVSEVAMQLEGDYGVLEECLARLEAML